jgi:hypothetical protein
VTQTAIKWAELCAEVLGQDPTLDRTLKNNLATWLEAIGNIERANKIFDQALSVKPFSFWSVPGHIQFLSRHNLLEKMSPCLDQISAQLDLSLLSNLSEDDISASELEKFLMDLSDHMLTNEAIRKATWSRKSINLAERIYLRAIDAARVRGLRIESAAIGRQLGVLYYQFSSLTGSDNT